MDTVTEANMAIAMAVSKTHKHTVSLITSCRVFLLSIILSRHNTHSHTVVLSPPANRRYRLHPPQLHSRVPGQWSSQSQGSDDGVSFSLHSFISTSIFLLFIYVFILHSSVSVVSHVITFSFFLHFEKVFFPFHLLSAFLCLCFSQFLFADVTLKDIEACFFSLHPLPLSSRLEAIKHLHIKKRVWVLRMSYT